MSQSPSVFNLDRGAARSSRPQRSPGSDSYELWRSLQSVVLTFHILGNVSFPSLDKNCDGSVCTAGGAAETKHAALMQRRKYHESLGDGVCPSYWEHWWVTGVTRLTLMFGPWVTVKPSHCFKKGNEKWPADVINFFFCSSAESSLFALLLVSVKLNIKTVKCWQAATLPDPLGFNVSAQQRPLWPQIYWKV